SLGWSSCAMLRAYARYMKQSLVPFSGDYIAETLSRHLPTTHLMLQLFHMRFDPAAGGSAVWTEEERQQRERRLQTRIIAALDDVQNLAEDRIIRQYMGLISATVRTNYFQRDAARQLKKYFSFKFRCAAIPELPLPKPLDRKSTRLNSSHVKMSYAV